MITCRGQILIAIKTEISDSIDTAPSEVEVEPTQTINEVTSRFPSYSHDCILYFVFCILYFDNQLGDTCFLLFLVIVIAMIDFAFCPHISFPWSLSLPRLYGCPPNCVRQKSHEHLCGIEFGKDHFPGPCKC